MNFLYLSPLYILFIEDRFAINKDLEEIIFIFLFLLNTVNVLFRIYITKSSSLFEKILNITISNIE